MNKSKIGKFLALVVTFAVVGLGGYIYIMQVVIDNKIQQASADDQLPQMDATELSRYDGTDPDLPLYLALDGYVYDVTVGSKFYLPGGDYHYLIAKDSSADLKIFGGNIIKQKYPIIASFVQ